jgi:hypothetical protein
MMMMRPSSPAEPGAGSAVEEAADAARELEEDDEADDDETVASTGVERFWIERTTCAAVSAKIDTKGESKD